MARITIPKKLVQRGDLVLVPKQEYEEFLAFKRIREFTPTLAQKRALARARRDFAKGRYVTLEELRRELDRRRSR
jgi:hypothetical protein